MKNVKWFDLEITDGIIDMDIKKKAIGIFKYWKYSKMIILGKQRTTSWRPKSNIVLITALKDFFQLSNLLEKDTVETTATTKIVFENESVLRFRIE